jgi:UDP-N-acetylglucosamine 4,6-dehydratase
VADPTRPLPADASPSPLAGTRILVTGGTGAFGRAFVRRALDAGAARVAILSRDEAKQAALKATLTDPRLRWFVGDIRDAERVRLAMHGIDTVVHAAAMKRIETCEADPLEAVKSNITGTWNVAQACMDAGVSRAVLLSTDKAAAPNTHYGATKMAAERLWNAANVYAAGTPTRFAATRYGNVLGSTGSVIPVWRAQLARGEALTITDPRMTRFWMPMRDAVALVVTALAEMRGGEVFVPRLGAASVLTLAKATIGEAYHRHPAPRTIGLRPGEKLHEMLISADEARQTYDALTHYVIEPAERTWADLPPLAWRKVAEGFTLASDTCPVQLGFDDLATMLEAA